MADVAILTSGIGLGVYLPALLIRRQLRARGVTAAVEVLEGYYTADGRQRHLTHRQAYHDNFALAVMAHRMTRGVETSLDHDRLEALLAGWHAARLTRFIVWSGFWLPILAHYRRQLGARLHLDRCRIDAVASASFRIYESEAGDELAHDSRDIWLWSAAEQRTVLEIPVDDRPALDLAARDRRLVIHGGGWNLGTYQARRAELEATSWQLDVVVHDPAEAEPRRPGDHYFRVDPAWRTWDAAPDHGFPPFGELDAGPAPGACDDHALYDRIRGCMAIVSKPGGGTLIDSLSSATPVVLLEPYGYAEAANAAVWEHLGFGVPYARWRDAGYSAELLAELHGNLRRRARGAAYPAAYAASLEQEST